MRILIVNSDYPAFLEWLYAQHPGLALCSYDEQLRTRNDSLFGTADFYPRNLIALGHEATEVHVNNRAMQLAWASGHGLKVGDDEKRRLTFRRGIVPWLKRDRSHWMEAILAAQMEKFRPDVIVTHSITDLEPRFWKCVSGRHRLLVGQIAAPLPRAVELNHFHLMLSSLPNVVQRFREAGVNAELFRLGFDPLVLDKLSDSGPPIDVTFVGSLTADHHGDRLQWLEFLCRAIDVKVFGPGVASLPADSAIRQAYQGTAWGIEMYRILRRSRVTLNHHIGIAGTHANNMRLYEATGVGACLLTDFKENLADMFEPEIEVGVYRSREECLERIHDFLDHEQQRQQTAAAGQQRTLREHTYRQRMEQLVSLISSRL